MTYSPSEDSVHTSEQSSRRSERTLLVIKPDGVAKRLVGEIVHEVEKAGFQILALEMMRLSTEKAEELYRAHKGKTFYLPLIDFVTSGPLVALILERNDAVRGLREIVGATDPERAQEGTLRRRFGTDVQKNAVHAAETEKDAEREIPILFGENPQN
jgi:nucleoside-diphosphate kinase